MPEDRRFELSEADLNILANLAEECNEVAIECNEVAKECNKIIRFSLDNTHHKYDETENTPRKRLSTETGQLLFLIHKLINNGMVDNVLVQKGYKGKAKAISTIPYNIVKIVEQYDPNFDSTQPTPDVMLRHNL